jgi:hypothetical protein
MEQGRKDSQLFVDIDYQIDYRLILAACLLLLEVYVLVRLTL